MHAHLVIPSQQRKSCGKARARRRGLAEAVARGLLGGSLVAWGASSAYGLQYVSVSASGTITNVAADPKQDNRFYVGADKNFVGQQYDLSGVATDYDEVDGRAWSGPCATLISPSFFVTAAHYGANPGAPMVFHENNDPNGPTHVYYTAGSSYYVKIGTTDIMIGRLATPVLPQDHISYYPIPDYSTMSAAVGKPLLVYGQGDQTALDTVNYVGGGMEYFSYNVPNQPNQGYAISGDSSHPSLLKIGNQTALVGVRYTGTGDPSLSSYISEINQILSSSGEFVRTIDANGNMSAAPTAAAALPLVTSPMTQSSLLAVTYSGTVYKYQPGTLQQTGSFPLAYCNSVQMGSSVAIAGGAIFVKDSIGGSGYAARILRYQADGTPAPAGGHGGATFTTAGDLAGMNGTDGINCLASGADGALYATNSTGIWRFDPNTAAGQKFITTTKPVTALFLGPDANNDQSSDFYAATNGGVNVYDGRTGSMVRTILASGTLGDIRDLVITQGRIVLSNGFNSGGDDRLHVFDATTGLPIDVGYGSGILNSYKFNHVGGLLLAPDGTVYADEQFSNKIWGVNVFTGAMTAALTPNTPVGIGYYAIPEPASVGLLVLALGGLAMRRRRGITTVG